MTDLANPGFVSAMDRARAPRRFTPPTLIGAALATALLASGAWFWLHPAERTLRMPLSKLTVSSVTRSTFHDFIPVRGQVEPLARVMLDAVQGGRVEEVLAEAGQRVVAGQKLIRLSEPTLELEAIARETQIIEQITNQRSLELNFEQTSTNDAKAVADTDYNIQRLTRTVDRKRPLAAKGFASQETMDQSADELAYQQRLHAIAIDAARRDAAVIAHGKDLLNQTAARLDANLKAAKSQLDALIVRAPADGLLTGLDAHVGEEKTRGQHLGEIDRDSGFRVRIKVDEFYLARVRAGQRVTAVIDGAPASLVVAKVYPQVMNGVFEVELNWDGAAPAGLRGGQAVQGKLELGGDAPALLLRAGPFLESSGGGWALVLERDGAAAKRRAIRLGRRNAESVEVIEGLEAGERVVTSDYSGLDRIDRLELTP